MGEGFEAVFVVGRFQAFVNKGADGCVVGFLSQSRGERFGDCAKHAVVAHDVQNAVGFGLVEFSDAA